MRIQTLLVVATCLVASTGCKSSGHEPGPGNDKTQPPSRPTPQPATATAAPAPSGPSWKPLTSAEGRFSVLMIEGAKQEKQTTRTAAGQAESVMWNAETPDGKAYSVAYSDIPGVTKASVPDKILDGARDGSVKNINGKLVSEKKITVGGRPGREMSIAVPDKSITVWTRNILVDNRLYVLQGLLRGSPRATPDPEVTRFFESFKLTR